MVPVEHVEPDADGEVGSPASNAQLSDRPRTVVV
jgi:hypothetical protein